MNSLICFVRFVRSLALVLVLGLLSALLPAGRPAAAQALAFDQVLACASGDGPDGWGPAAQAFDAAGNRYVAGQFSGTIALGGTVLTATQTAATRTGPSDTFVAKIDAAGTYAWAVQFGDNQASQVSALAVDGAGHLYLAGSFDSYDLRIGGGTPVLYNSGPSAEAFVAQLSSGSGQLQWARRAGGVRNDYATRLALSAAGDVYAAFQMSSPSVSFGTTTLANPYLGGAAFLAKLSASGAWQWARPVGDGTARANSLALDAQGGIYLAGSFRNSLTIGAASLTSQPIAGTPFFWGADVFVAKTTDAGGWLWAVQGDAVTHRNFIDYGGEIALDGNGHVYVVGGYANSAARFGNVVLPNLSSVQPPYNPQAPPYPGYYYTDAYISRLDAATGAWEWAARYGGAEQDVASQPILDGQGRFYVTGGWFGPDYKLGRIDPATGTLLASQPLPTPGYMGLDGQNRLNFIGSIGVTPTAFGSVTLQPAGPNRGTGYVARLGAGPLATRPAQRGPGLAVWPNPAGGGAVWVQGPAAGQAVQVFDVLGRAVAAGRMPAAGPLALPLALPAGVYVVRSAGQARRLVIE